MGKAPQYRKLITPYIEGTASMVRSPFDGHNGFSYWTSWNKEWIDAEWAADPFFTMKDAYDEYFDITPEEAERTIKYYEGKN